MINTRNYSRVNIHDSFWSYYDFKLFVSNTLDEVSNASKRNFKRTSRWIIHNRIDIIFHMELWTSSFNEMLQSLIERYTSKERPRVSCHVLLLTMDKWVQYIFIKIKSNNLIVVWQERVLVDWAAHKQILNKYSHETRVSILKWCNWSYKFYCQRHSLIKMVHHSWTTNSTQYDKKAILFFDCHMETVTIVDTLY